MITQDTNTIPDNWLETTAAMAIRQGYHPIPMAKKDQPAGKFKDGETYPSNHRLWKTACRNIIGIRLDDFILVDYDGNKPKGAIPLADLFGILGDEPTSVQENDKGDSIHFLYRIPADIDKTTLKHSHDDWHHGIDVKTMNQLMHLKQHKTIIDDELPALDEIPDAPQAILDALTKVTSENLQKRGDSPAGKLKAAEIISYINADCTYKEWLAVGMGLHHEFNGDVLGLHVWDNWSAGGESYKGWGSLEYKWNSFNSDLSEQQTTFGTICKMAQEAGADLKAINKKYDENGELLPTFEEMLEQAEHLTPESDIEALLKYCRSLSAIQKRRLLTTIKTSTGIPLGTLEDAIKEVSPESDELDQLALAQAVVNEIGRENIIAAQSFVWAWEDTGVWRKQEDRSIKQYVQKIVPTKLDKVTKNIVDGVTDLFKTEVFSPDHKFDIGEPESVNCLNGQLTLSNEAGGWLLGKHAREDYRTTQLPVNYDKDALAPRFTQFMSEVFAGDIDAGDKTKALLEMIGYTLLAHCRHERFIILVGSGANGKSVLLSVLEALCGADNVACVQPAQFDNKFQRAYLHGKLANIVTEIEQGATIADGALKSIVSGEGTTAENKFGHPFTFHPFSTCWFGTNHMPHTRDFSDAVFRRTLVVSFNNAFKPELGNCDPMLKDKLLEELSGILNLALSAYANALLNGFTRPASSETAAQEWRMEVDQVAQFVNDQGTKEPSARVPIGEAYSQYKDWAHDNGINKPVVTKSFRERLTRLGFGYDRDSKNRYVTGLKLNRPDPFYQSDYQKASNGF